MMKKETRITSRRNDNEATIMMRIAGVMRVLIIIMIMMTRTVTVVVAVVVMVVIVVVSIIISFPRCFH